MENTHIGRALKLRWNSRAWFVKNFISVSAAVSGSIGEGDGIVPGQEYNEGIEAAYQIITEASTQSCREPRRGNIEVAGG